MKLIKHIKNIFSRPSKVSIKSYWKLAWGKIRRFYLYNFNRGFVKKAHEKRTGECAQCGSCCKLMYDCPHLIPKEDGSTYCEIHHQRVNNCRVFPIDYRDIEERNCIAPHIPCGYSVGIGVPPGKKPQGGDDRSQEKEK